MIKSREFCKEYSEVEGVDDMFSSFFVKIPESVAPRLVKDMQDWLQSLEADDKVESQLKNGAWGRLKQTFFKS